MCTLKLDYRNSHFPFVSDCLYGRIIFAGLFCVCRIDLLCCFCRVKGGVFMAQISVEHLTFAYEGSFDVNAS